MSKKLPSFQFYPGDHLKEPSLRRCSKAAKGVWFDMICISFECEERGVFQTSGVPWPDGDIAAAVGGDIAENLHALEELLAKGVCSRNQSGAVFCRRVVRDERKRRLCGEAGKMGGGNPALRKGAAKGGIKGTLIGGSKRNPKASSSSSDEEGALPPSSSTSAAASASVSPAEPPPEAASLAPPPTAAAPKAASPEESASPPGSAKSADPPRRVDRSEDILAVFEHYRKHRPKRHLRPNSESKEWKHIRARLSEGFTVADLCEAIDGMMRSPFHQGENDRGGTMFDSLELVVRNSSQIEKFKAIPERAPVISQSAKFTHRAAESYLQRRFPSQEELEHDAPY